MQDNSLHRKHSLHTKSFYTQTLLHTDPFTHRPFSTQSFYPQKLLHTDAFTQTLLHTDTFTHRHFYTDTFTYKAFAHRSFYIQKLLQTYTLTSLIHSYHFGVKLSMPTKHAKQTSQDCLKLASKT